MKPDQRFGKQDKAFWACVRSLSQDLGYTVRGEDRIKVPTIPEMRQGFIDLELNPLAIIDRQNKPTDLARILHSYFEYRAKVLGTVAAQKLMKVDQARTLFEQYRRELRPKCPLPMNKQKGDMKAPAYLTGLVNMMVESHSGNADCDYDPRKLTTVTREGVPLRTLARRVDGAFPNSVNPIAIWEIKEYYYTTTFGSRVADGVYESLAIMHLTTPFGALRCADEQRMYLYPERQESPGRSDPHDGHAAVLHRGGRARLLRGAALA